MESFLTSNSLSPGLMLIHGNRSERLRDLLVEWMKRCPLAPLENEVILAQSNGIAQWLKLALAADRDPATSVIKSTSLTQLTVSPPDVPVANQRHASPGTTAFFRSVIRKGRYGDRAFTDCARRPRWAAQGSGQCRRIGATHDRT